MSFLGGQLAGDGHRATSGTLGRWRRWRRLPGFVMARLTLGLGEDGEAEEEQEEEAAWQDAHCG